MFRQRLIGGLASLGVMAGLLTVGAISPASAGQDHGSYIPSQPNPTLQAQCGLDFGLVLDSSGSIGNTGITNLKDAANSFVDALVDTGSNVSVTSFSTSSPGSGGVNLGPTALTSGNLSNIKDSYQNLASNGWTNWEDGLYQMEQFSGTPDLVVFITDGNPNTTRTSTPGQYVDGSPAAVNPAITIANSLKTAGAKMFGIAVGPNIKLGPIQAVTNSTAYDGSNFATAGYVTTTNYATLATQLKELAVELCAPSLNITKYTETPDGYGPADGWTFDTTVTLPDGSGNWIKPSAGTISQGVPSTKTAATSNGGAVNFQWEPNGDKDSKVSVKETLANGYQRYRYLDCQAKNVLDNKVRSFSPDVDNQGKWDLGTIKAREIVTCSAFNTLTELKLVKKIEGPGDPDAWTLSATPADPEAPGVSNKGGSGTFQPIWAGVEYTLAEDGPGGYSPGDWYCTGLDRERAARAEQRQLNDGDKLTVYPGDRVTCTITNTRDYAELKLVKQVASGSAPADAFTLSAAAAAPDNDLNFSNQGGSGDFTRVYAGTPYKLSESGPAGYTGSSWVCEGREVIPQVLQAGDEVTLNKNERVTCTIVNTRDTGSLTITKEFNPQNSGYSGTFDIAYSCVDGATAVKSGTVTVGAGQSSTVSDLPTGTTCTVTEPTLPTAPAGWSFNPPTFTPANGQVTIGKDQAATVLVTNSISQVSPVSVKRPCPIDVSMVKPKVKRVGNHLLIKRVKTRSASCFIVKPVVLCRPVGSGAAGETAFCDTTSRTSGRVRVDTQGYDAVKVTVVVRAKPKAGFADNWKAKTWRKSWTLR